ncbi:hypothetical protein B0H66DRAFT_577772 [Apodospora peruviana]|uniref:Glycosyl transferase CAP10 domain-containing protein n=1 Tax=Apodospora peruviana TaxID=516989 RepID=A0AAE0HWP3_9PEZI|nr:hypothetical protein B0H66DRAFT_577772 [Apodospora peruviana]
MGFPSRRPTTLLRFLVPAVLIILVLYYMSSPESVLSSVPSTPGSETQPYKTPAVPPATGIDHNHDEEEQKQEEQQQQQEEELPVADEELAFTSTIATDQAATSTSTATLATGTHPIDIRIRAAEEEFAEKLSRESKSLADAAAAYRERRGRHPPPGFKEWYEFAKENNAVMVEDFWDQIYHDLEPFWGLKPGRIRKDAWDFEMRISIRNHKASSGSDWFWTKIWLKLIKTIEHVLPDMDIALNAMDEPRLVVPWEKIDEYVTEAKKTRKIKEAAGVVTKFRSLPPPGEGDVDEVTPKKEWEKTKHYWLIARRGCAPDSPARKAAIMNEFDRRPYIPDNFAAPHMESGYVKNYTASTLFCNQPDLQGLNGIFVEPLSVSATDTLFPMFGGSKLAVNNEILLPAPMYWNEEERFTGKSDADVPWEDKDDKVIWRGVATGGRNRESNWRAFQRHRFVAMNNGTKLTRAEEWTELPNNFVLPTSAYALKAQEDGKLGEWVSRWANVSFVDLMCSNPEEKGDKGIGCNYTDPYFSTYPGVKMARQFHYKYLPDIDGNSFSGRYLGFLRSTSLPIKATVWREWHDSRLVPWKHFVPMDNRFSDWYGIMEYFVGYEDRNVEGHDEVAKQIAFAGKEWAERALRKEDMQIYVMRLLLEYARLSSDEREDMGWVGDLVGSSTGGPGSRPGGSEASNRQRVGPRWRGGGAA